MKEIRLTIPDGCKAVTVKVDGEQVITEVEPLPRWRGHEDEGYYYVSKYGWPEPDSDDGGCFHDLLYKCGNYFRTREAAERVAEQIREIFKKSKAK